MSVARRRLSEKHNFRNFRLRRSENFKKRTFSSEFSFMIMTAIYLMWIMSVLVLGSIWEASGEEIPLDVALSLAKHFSVSFCLIGVPEGRSDLDLISMKSHPSKGDLLTSVLTFDQMSRFLSEELYLAPGGRTMVVMKLGSSSLEYLSQLSLNNSISTATWILFSDSPFREELFQNIYIPFDCEFIFVRENNNSFFLTEIYQFKRKSEFETFEFGLWTKEKGLAVTNIHFYARRNNLKGHKLTAIVSNDPPYVSIKKDEIGKRKLTGYLYEIWNELEFRLNFRTEFPEKFLDKNVNQILKNEDVDFALARISIVASSFEEMDFSQPIHEAKSYMFCQRPGSELDWDSYLKPFSANTWFVCIFWMLSSSLALTILYKKAWDCGTSEREADYYVFTFSESILTVFRAICMQGSDVTPKSNSCRFFFLSIYLTALVVTSAFSAALFSLLTIPKPRSPFNSVEEVLANNKFQIGFPSDPHFHKLVEDFSSTLTFASQLKLLEKLMASKGNYLETPLQGLEQICRDKSYVFMFDLPDVLYLMQNATRSCRDKILPSGPPLFTQHIGFGFKKKNPFKRLINFHLIRMKNEGILNRLLLNYWPPQIPTVQATWVRVTLSDISPILYMFALGALLGASFLYAERAFLHLRKKRKKKENKQKNGKNNDSRHFLEKKILSPALKKNHSNGWPLYYRLN